MPKLKLPIPKSWVEISSAALKRNIKIFKKLIKPGTHLLVTVKANAYGHGLVEVAKVAQQEGIKCFGVDALEEGLKLRAAGIKGLILVLGFVRPENIELAVKNNISFVAYDEGVFKKLQSLSKSGLLKKRPAKVHLKIETGTGRQGLRGDELTAYAKKLKNVKGVVIEGVYTHYANIEDTTDHSFAAQQLKSFLMEKKKLAEIGIEPEFSHTACSAAAILFPETHFNLIRLGIALYGLWPSKETRAVAQRTHRDIRLEPVMTWKTIVAQVKKYPKGTSIGYGLSERLSRASKLAVLPVGYWDGFDRGQASIGTVLIRGHRCKVVGRIFMNMMNVDVTDVPGVKPEDEAVLIGKQKKEIVSAEEFAGKIGTINYEVVARINPLLSRRLID
ncbi:MAG: alanine racemase [Patescibacteria group bacterium]|nr:alanine racemase [Patescibacteria group bacterium]